MIKKIGAVEARKSLGQVMNQVNQEGDDYIVERSGKPLVAIVSLEKYERLQENKNDFFASVKQIQARVKNKNSKSVNTALKEALNSIK